MSIALFIVSLHVNHNVRNRLFHGSWGCFDDIFLAVLKCLDYFTIDRLHLYCLWLSFI